MLQATIRYTRTIARCSDCEATAIAHGWSIGMLVPTSWGEPMPIIEALDGDFAMHRCQVCGGTVVGAGPDAPEPWEEPAPADGLLVVWMEPEPQRGTPVGRLLGPLEPREIEPVGPPGWSAWLWDRSHGNDLTGVRGSVSPRGLVIAAKVCPTCGRRVLDPEGVRVLAIPAASEPRPFGVPRCDCCDATLHASDERWLDAIPDLETEHQRP